MTSQIVYLKVTLSPEVSQEQVVEERTAVSNWGSGGAKAPRSLNSNLSYIHVKRDSLSADLL